VILVLLVTAESPLQAGGGIATYILNAAKAHLTAGNRVLIASWKIGNEADEPRPADWLRVHPLNASHFRQIVIPQTEIDSSCVAGWEMRLAVHVSERIEVLINRERPSVVEGADYNFTLLPLLQRARAGQLAHRPIFLTFHHGLQEDVFSAAGLIAGTALQKLFAGERNVMRFADGILVPSQTAMDNLSAAKGFERERMFLCREPFFWPERTSCVFSEHRDRYLYFGRVTFAKGVDRVCRFFDYLCGPDEHKDLHIIGPFVEFPVKKSLPQDYLRLDRNYGTVKLDYRRFTLEELSLILSRFGTFLNFSRTETFSYTSVEAISRGLRVMTDRRGAAAELYPPALRMLLPKDWDTRPNEARRADGEIGESEVLEVQSYARALTAPSGFADRYAQIVEELTNRSKPKRVARFSNGGSCHRDVSALLSTYNDGPVLLEAIESILSQEASVAEILVYNDGSADPVSLDIYSKLGTLPPIKLINGDPIGLIGGRNRLLAAASCSFCFFLDADDRIKPDFLSKSLEMFYASEEALDAVIPWRQNFGLSHELICDFLLYTPMHFATNDFRMTALIRTAVAKQIGFRPDLVHGEADDWDFWLKFSLLGFKAEALPEAALMYRVSAGSMSFRWTEGQARLSANLIGNSIRELAAEGKITPNTVEYLFKMLYSYRYFSEK